MGHVCHGLPYKLYIGIIYGKSVHTMFRCCLHGSMLAATKVYNAAYNESELDHFTTT